MVKRGSKHFSLMAEDRDGNYVVAQYQEVGTSKEPVAQDMELAKSEVKKETKEKHLIRKEKNTRKWTCGTGWVKRQKMADPYAVENYERQSAHVL